MRIRAGYAAVSAAAILWAAGGTYASYLIDRGASFVELTEARAWITAAALAVLYGLRRPPAENGERLGPGWIVAFGASIAAANFTYYASLSRLPVAVAITVQYTAPALVVGWAAFAQRRAPAPRVVLALVGAMFGVARLAELPVVIAEGALRVDALGLVTAIASAFAFATYMITGERVARAFGARRSVFRGFVVASAIWIVVQVIRGRPDTLLDVRFLPGIVFLAVATTIAPFLLFVWGLERIRATDAGIVSTLEPLTAALIAYIWLQQMLSSWQIVGAAAVLIAITIVQLSSPAPIDVLEERAAVE